MNELLEKLKENKVVVIAVLVVFLVMIVVILVLLDQTGDEESMYTLPIESEDNTDYRWDNVHIGTDAVQQSVKKLPTYWGNTYSVSEVESVVAELGFTGVKKEVSDDGMYHSWVDGDEFARYNTTTGDLTVNATAIRLAEIERGYVAEGSFEEYFEEFMTVYFDAELELSFTVDRVGGGYRVTGTWLLDEYPLVHIGGQEYSYIAQFTDGGDLVNLYIRLIHISKTDQKVDIVSVSELRSYLRTNGYPKEAYIDVIPSGDSCEGEDCDPYGMYTLDGFEMAEISDVSIVYLYDFSSCDILPIYRLGGTGTARDKDGEAFEVTAMIYANAIDPTRILMESGD